VITGEGKVDRQTAFGKAPAGVARVAKAAGVPVVAVGGIVDESAAELYEHGFVAVIAAVRAPMALEQAMQAEQARANLRYAGEQIMRLWLAARRGVQRA